MVARIEDAGTTPRYLSSLSTRLLLPVPITLIIAIGLVWFIVPRVVASMAINDAILANKQTAVQIKTVRGYYSENVVDKVAGKSGFTVAHDHKTNPNAIPVPATMVHDLSATLANNDTTIALYSPYPFPIFKDRKLDDFQQEAWAFLKANPKETFSRSEVRDGHQIVRVAIADTMSSTSCLNCHNNDPQSPRRDWKLGDVRGVLEIASVVDAQLAHGSTLTQMIVAGAFLIGLLLLALTYWVTRSVIKPLTTIIDDMQKLATGHFDVVIPGRERTDEIGAMARAVEAVKARAMDRARSRAEEREQQIQTAASQRKDEMHKLADGFEAAVGKIVDVVSSASSGLEAAANTLSNNAETTREMSGVVTNASEEASSNVQSVAMATSELNRSVIEIGQQVTESKRIAAEAVEQAEQTDARIGQLSDAATRIGNVVKLITTIAQQTNLLALNATIEAARAGDAGKGFAVVAAEVKMLATETAKATEEISTQIAEIQMATRDSVGAIKEIGATIGRISDIAMIIAAAVEEQSAMAGEIARNVEHAAESATRVAANINDVSRAAGETGSASSHVLDSARLLSNEGARLRTEVDKFLATVRAA